MIKLKKKIAKFLSSPKKLKIYFFLMFMFLALLIVCISFFINYIYQEKTISKNIQNEAVITINQKKELLKANIDNYRVIINSIAKSNILAEYLKSSNNKENISSLLESIISANKSIMQVRYIDENGMENIRFDRQEEGGEYVNIKEYLLQNKKDRYYFTEVAKRNPESVVWISDIDLNIEKGKIQIPYVPVIRFAKPVYQDKKFKGIVIINVFMKNTLDQLMDSSLFRVSLVDKEGEVLVGKYETLQGVLDYSWSRYTYKKVDLNIFSDFHIEDIIHFHESHSKLHHSLEISKDLGLSQELILLLTLKQEKITELKEETILKIVDTLVIIFLISAVIGIVLSYIPSKLAEKLHDASVQLDEKSMRFNEYLSAMNINNIITRGNLEGKITYVNDNFCKVTGYTEDEVLNKPHSILRDPTQRSEIFKILWLTIQSGKVWQGELRNRKKDGTFYNVDMVVMPIKNIKGDIVEYVAIRHDITELVEQRKKLLLTATHDDWTGVGNRYKLTNDIQNHIVNNVAVITIDNFSHINNFFGHQIGYEIIKKFSILLLDNLTNEFRLYRLHKDEFAILNFTLDCKRFTNFIVHLNNIMIESIIETDVESFDIVTTVGISSYDKELVLTTAEIANKHANKLKKKFLVYSPELNIEEEFKNNITWSQKIKKALDEDRITVFYQAIYNNKTKVIEKYESLVRLIDEDGEVISPYYFLDIAKSSGQYKDITKVVIEKSFKNFEKMNLEFSINLTIEDILDSEICNFLEDKIDQYNVADKLVLELVESEGIEEFESIQKFIKRLKGFGCRVAIDDFGTGYSNFEYLVKLNADYIKIDGSMISTINSDKNMKEIVKTIVEFSQKMEYKIIGEYVSSEDILETVQELNIDYSQGFYFGKPEPYIDNRIS